ncbi:MAG: hypothetical protein OET44_15845 [Gammaproteobacteria bacterium]|nr:hypothetical protein [Gammaproteobacteria bacterium]
MRNRKPQGQVDCRSNRLSLRDSSDWWQLSRTRRDAPDTPSSPVNARFEIERVDRHGVVGYHLYPRGE